jgi:hypothetical protein
MSQSAHAERTARLVAVVGSVGREPAPTAPFESLVHDGDHNHTVEADDVKRWMCGSAAAALELQKPAPVSAIVVRPSETKAA